MPLTECFGAKDWGTVMTPSFPFTFPAQTVNLALGVRDPTRGLPGRASLLPQVTPGINPEHSRGPRTGVWGRRGPIGAPFWLLASGCDARTFLTAFNRFPRL